MNYVNNMKISTKLFFSFGLVLALMVGISYFAISSLQTIDAYVNEMYHDRLVPVHDLGQIEVNLFTVRGDSYKYIVLPQERATIKTAINDNLKAIDSLTAKYSATQLLKEEEKEISVFRSALAEYKLALQEFFNFADSGNSDAAVKSIADGGRVANARKAVGASTEKLVDINVKQSEILWNLAQENYQRTRLIMLGLALLSTVVGIAAALLIVSSLNKPLQLMATMMTNISVGDLNHDIDRRAKEETANRKDEVGTAGKALLAAENYLLEMAEVARKVAGGDLCVSVKPRSPKDELGNAFQQMVQGLCKAVREIAQSADSVGAASAQLASAANQAGQATSQIATTIQQVAKGTSQQAESITKTASSVEQMSRAIEGVAKGAQEQAAAVAKASTVTNQISAAIQQVAGNAAAVVKEADNAAKAAREGSQVVEETIAGMNSIKSKVGISAEKVQEMGSRSGQIGEIVSTIEDIASQTNLLALNAAIEAARAGEAGKGFAVVADEVRKLAERASAATREIGGLVKSIQKSVSEAVSAMDEGAKEVLSGVERAAKAGDSLADILKAAEAVNIQAKQAATASQSMAASANELVASVDTVSAVVEENTASTEEMAAGSGEVTQAIENIASISEENSASIEEVSASAEEMSAQVEEVTASASSLAELGRALRNVVAQFKLPA